MAFLRLDGLPSRVIRTLFEVDPSLIHLFLVALQSKSLHRLARDTVYQSITIQPTSDPNPLLDTILNGHHSYGAAVTSINVISPPHHADHHQPSPSLSSSHSSDLIPSNWDSDFFPRLLSKLPNLRSFRWSSDRLPTHGLCTLIGLHLPSLESFSFDIPTCSQLQPPLTPSRPTGRPRAHTNGWLEDSDSDSELLASRPLRWDLDGIEALPTTLTHLSISSLSAIGAKNLSRAFEAFTWTALTELTLSKSLFIDDDLMGSIILGSKKIKRLKIQSMCGTKLTERGIEQLFSSLDELEEIELLDVEGRFSKAGWLKLDNLPSSLKSVKFGYHETGSYHSWTLDHLQNVVSLVGLFPQQLERFSVTRFVPLPALLPGRHAMFPELAFNNRTTPKKISKDQIMTICAEGKNLKELNIDWWLISIEGLEVIVKGLPNLLKLTALVDAPFHRIITSTVFVHSKIQTLKVSIPPEHTPLVQELVQVPMMPTFQTFKHVPFSPAASHQSSIQLLSPGSTSTLSSPIPTRDMKKFIKRAGHLKEIIWTGRGGLGSWKFLRNGVSALNVKVEFLPITDQLPLEAFEYQQSIRQQQAAAIDPSVNPKHPCQYHQRAGSSPRQNGSSGQFTCKNVAINSNGNRSKRRTSSVTTTEESTNNDSHDYSRRSSSGSLSTSWSSGCHYLSGNYHKTGLEGIPGTPAGEREDKNIDNDHLNNKDFENSSIINPCHKLIKELLVDGQFRN